VRAASTRRFGRSILHLGLLFGPLIQTILATAEPHEVGNAAGTTEGSEQ
jgi:hypothetical protein